MKSDNIILAILEFFLIKNSILLIGKVDSIMIFFPRLYLLSNKWFVFPENRWFTCKKLLDQYYFSHQLIHKFLLIFLV